MPSDRPPRAGTAHLVRPENDGGTGPGVLLLHSWWGLTSFVKAQCEQLADAGFVALAPDILGGARPETAAEAEFELGVSDPNETAALVLSSIVALRSQTADPDAAIAVVGYSMGASWALWAATRQPESVRAVVAYYGTQNIDFELLRAPVLGHFADDDEIVSIDELIEMQSHLLLLEKSVEVHRYEGCHHFFAEPSPEETLEPAAAELAWGRTIEFLHHHSSSL
jgi:carboxymethylenebutenolidase